MACRWHPQIAAVSKRLDPLVKLQRFWELTQSILCGGVWVTKFLNCGGAWVNKCLKLIFEGLPERTISNLSASVLHPAPLQPEDQHTFADTFPALIHYKAKSGRLSGNFEFVFPSTKRILRV